MKKTSPSILLMFSQLLCTTLPGYAALQGEFVYIGYELEFDSSGPVSYNDTKWISGENTLISVTSSNTFTGIFSGWGMERVISNRLVEVSSNPPDYQCINGYAAGFYAETGMATGTVELATNLVLMARLEGEAEPTPFFFNTTTNLGLTLFQDSGSQGVGLLLRRGQGMDNASIEGNYVRYTLGNAFYGQTTNDWGSAEQFSLERSTMAFDGIGQFSEAPLTQMAERATTEYATNASGQTVINTAFELSQEGIVPIGTIMPYSVTADGYLLLPSDIGTITNPISADGEFVSSFAGAGESNVFAGTYFTAAVRQPGSMPTNAVDEVYFVMQLGESFHGSSPSAGADINSIEVGYSYLFLNRDGTFTVRSDDWENDHQLYNQLFDSSDFVPTNSSGDLVSANVFRVYSSDRTTEFDRGTYSIATNGVFTLQFDDGDAGQGQLSANGEYLVYGSMGGDGSGQERLMGIGIRRIAPPPPSSPVTLEAVGMTPTGMALRINLPADYPVEGLYTDELNSGEWYFGTELISPTGQVETVDTTATNSAQRFYRATFIPW